MPKGALRSAQDIEDFTRGTDFLSASGGGPTTESRAFLQEALDLGRKVEWIDLGELPDEAAVAAAFFTGSVAPTRYARGDREKEYGIRTSVAHPPLAAVEELERRSGRKLDVLIPIEIGGNNTGQCLATAALLGKLVPDADFAGRAIPEATCTTPHMAGLKMAPFACATYYGDRVFVEGCANNLIAERLGKHVAMSSFGSAGCAAFMMSGAEAKRIAIPGTLTRSFLIGRTIREARDSGRDPAEELVNRLSDMWVLFKGRILRRQWENRDGYMWGEHELEGNGPFTGRRLRLWFKNENHLSWLDGEPFVTGPDVIEIIDPPTGEPLVNSFLEEGQPVAVIGIKRCAQFDSRAGVDALGPSHWGFDFPYRPIESLVGRLS
ncbi:MAG TPA: DUF917 domain-containing protein [Alphaproteobacteria bacterium]|nr:DUF917 domain-containing protein [Alphaproteobacteria bacterium]